MAEEVLKHLAMRRYEAPFVLEGGAVHTDGEGTLLTTDSVLLNPNRNPGIGRADMEESAGGLSRHPQGDLAGRGAEGRRHRRARRQPRLLREAGRRAGASASDPADANHGPLKDNIARLRAATDAQGRALEVIEIEQPRARYMPDGRRIAASYINFYFANGAVIMPVFEDPQDARAFEIVGKAFPGPRGRAGAGHRHRLWRRRHPLHHPAAAGGHAGGAVRQG